VILLTALMIRHRATTESMEHVKGSIGWCACVMDDMHDDSYGV
jgi:hypothetical protein